MSLKRVPAGAESNNCPRPQLIFIAKKISTKTAIFITAKHEHINLAVI